MQANPFARMIALSMLIILPACSPARSDISISDAWTRPFQSESGLPTALYFALENNTPTSAQLIGATIASADTVEIHQSELVDGFMRMRAQRDVTIETKAVLRFEPGSHHLMIKGLSADLALDDSLQFTLHFANHPPIDAHAVVKWE